MDTMLTFTKRSLQPFFISIEFSNCLHKLLSVYFTIENLLANLYLGESFALHFPYAIYVLIAPPAKFQEMVSI